MSQRKFRLAKASVRIFPAVGQDTAWNSPLSDRQQWGSGKPRNTAWLRKYWTCKEKQWRKCWEKHTCYSNCWAVSFATSWGRFGFGFWFVFFWFFFHSANCLWVCFTWRLPTRLDEHLPVSISQLLESSAPVLMAGQRGSQKTRFPSSFGEARNSEVSLWIATGPHLGIFESPMVLH